MTTTTKHTLPSGLVLELADYRTWTGADVQDVWDAISDGGAAGVREARAACLSKLLVSSSDPAALSSPPAPQQLFALRADDYVAVVALIRDAYDLVNGRGVIPNVDDYADPTPPTADTSGSDPD